MRKTALALFAIIAVSTAFAVPGTISGYTGTKTEVYLPAIFEGAAVTNIADYAFLDKDAITGIYAPDSVRTVGLHAFLRCASLLAVRLDGVHNVGDEAFYECRALTCISLPAVTNIGAYAWNQCTALTNVVLGATVEYIGARAFLGCTNLQSVMFSGSPPATGGDVFSNAPNVTVIITEPTASGWGTTFAGRPVVRYAVYGNNTDAHMATHGVTDAGGFVGGDGASVSTGGGAIGLEAIALTGGAVGEFAEATRGGAVGEFAAAGDGFAGGRGARAYDGVMPIDAIQLGTGVNQDAGTLQVYSHKLMDADGTIPVERIPAAITNGLLSQAGAAATYLPLANIPGPGCTDLGSTNFFDVSGATVYYRGVMSGAATATVTKAVSEGWTYALTVVGTNTLIISNATLLNTWTPGGTNTYVFTPSTTNAWEVRGMTP